jgi:molecular chaperone HscB
MSSPLFCDNCRSLYPAEGLNHFELLGLPPAFDLDPAALRRRYLELSRGVHPDHHPDADASASLRISAQLNEAKRVLADPVLRAEYLLELHGGSSAADDKSVQEGVLAETLMLRDEAAEALAAGDQERLESCRIAARKKRDRTLAEITDLARQLPGDEHIRRQLRAALNSIKYYQRVLAEI